MEKTRTELQADILHMVITWSGESQVMPWKIMLRHNAGKLMTLRLVYMPYLKI